MNTALIVAGIVIVLLVRTAYKVTVEMSRMEEEEIREMEMYYGSEQL